MVTRVTNQAQQATALRNIFRITEDLFRTNERIATGKRVNRLSDDPAAVRDGLTLRGSISQSEQFQRNIENNRVLSQTADTVLDSLGLNLIRARELGLQSLSGTNTPSTRAFSATELNALIEQSLDAANTKIKNQFLFSGTAARVQPFLRAGTEIFYQGNTQQPQIEIAENQPVGLSLPGSDMLATDLNPAVSGNTLLADLNGGAGVAAGSFSITDRAGNNAVIAVSPFATVNTVISAINAAGLNVNASLNSTRTGLLLTDVSPTLTGSLTVADVGNGTTAQDLGIRGLRDGNFSGRDLNPRVTGATLVADLNGGQGLTLGTVNVVNGAASGAVSLSTAATVTDLLNVFNTSAFNVTASINSQGNALRVVSNSASTVAMVLDFGGGTSAEDLGVGGSRNVFLAMSRLQESLAKNDSFGIIASLDVLEAGLTNLNEARAQLGAIARRLDTTESVHESNIVDQTRQLATVEDADISLEASNLVQLEFALQATLSTTARIIRPSLLDFLG
ncbi:MAG: flagellar hook-associated protein FlgL [Nitrospinaceae bacterium]